MYYFLGRPPLGPTDIKEERGKMMFMVSKPEKTKESNDPECPFCSLKFLSDSDLQKHNNDFHSMDVNETSVSEEKPTYTKEGSLAYTNL